MKWQLIEHRSSQQVNGLPNGLVLCSTVEITSSSIPEHSLCAQPPQTVFVLEFLEIVLPIVSVFGWVFESISRESNGFNVENSDFTNDFGSEKSGLNSEYDFDTTGVSSLTPQSLFNSSSEYNNEYNFKSTSIRILYNSAFYNNEIVLSEISLPDSNYISSDFFGSIALRNANTNTSWVDRSAKISSSSIDINIGIKDRKISKCWQLFNIGKKNFISDKSGTMECCCQELEYIDYGDVNDLNNLEWYIEAFNDYILEQNIFMYNVDFDNYKNQNDPSSCSVGSPTINQFKQTSTINENIAPVLSSASSIFSIVSKSKVHLVLQEADPFLWPTIVVASIFDVSACFVNVFVWCLVTSSKRDRASHMQSGNDDTLGGSFGKVGAVDVIPLILQDMFDHPNQTFGMPVVFAYLNDPIPMLNSNCHENENELELELENVHCDLYFHDYDLCNGYYSTPYPRHATSTPTFYFNYIGVGLRENFVFECIFNADCNGMGFDYDLSNISECDFNGNVCDCGYYSTPTPCPTPQIILIFNIIDTGLCENDLLKGVFGVDYNEYVFGNEMDNEMNNNGM